MNSAPSPEEVQAQRRFMVISLARFGGVALILGGILAANAALPVAVPDVAAYGVIALGMFATFFLPTMLARRWSSRKRP